MRDWSIVTLLKGPATGWCPAQLVALSRVAHDAHAFGGWLKVDPICHMTGGMRSQSHSIPPASCWGLRPKKEGPVPRAFVAAPVDALFPSIRLRHPNF